MKTDADTLSFSFLPCFDYPPHLPTTNITQTLTIPFYNQPSSTIFSPISVTHIPTTPGSHKPPNTHATQHPTNQRSTLSLPSLSLNGDRKAS